MRRKHLNVIGAGFLLTGLALTGCTHPYIGTYVKETLPDQHLELKKDHTFSLFEAQNFEGKYHIQGQTITLTTTTGTTVTATLFSNMVVDAHGHKWIKQSPPTP